MKVLILAFAWRGLIETTKNLSQESQGPCWDFNQVPPEYREEVLLVQ
jgi:hypothetical protein